MPQLSEIGPGQGALDRGATVRVDDRSDAADAVGGDRQPRAPARRRPVGDASATSTAATSDLTAVVNVAVTADDYTPLSITNPLDGTPLTIYSQSAATIGRVDNVLLNSDLLTQKYDGGEVTVNRRFDAAAHAVRRRHRRQQQGGDARPAATRTIRSTPTATTRSTRA